MVVFLYALNNSNHPINDEIRKLIARNIAGKDRNQTSIFPLSLDEVIDEQNEIRFVDLFVDSLKLGEYGFNTHFSCKRQAWLTSRIFGP